MFGYGLYGGDFATVRQAQRADADARFVDEAGAAIDAMAAKDARDRANVAAGRREVLAEIEALGREVAEMRRRRDADARWEAEAARRVPHLERKLAETKARRAEVLAGPGAEAREHGRLADEVEATLPALAAEVGDLRTQSAEVEGRTSATMVRREASLAREREALSGASAGAEVCALLAEAVRAVDPGNALLRVSDGETGHARAWREGRERAAAEAAEERARNAAATAAATAA